MRIHPVSTLRGVIQVPADKSISHRYAILSAMATGTSRIHNFSPSLDCHSTLSCLRTLGVGIRQQGKDVEINSSGWRRFQPPRQTLDAGNSGTTIRLVSALLSASAFVSRIQGDESLNRRPMKRIITPLSQMGASIEAREGEYPPLAFQGARLRGIRYQLPVASAQVKSCVLLAGLMAEGDTTVTEGVPARDHTERALPFFEAPFEKHNGELQVRGPATLKAASMEIPGDFSAAAFFITAALLVPGAQISISNVGVNPSRTALLVLLEKSGARIEPSRTRVVNNEPVCDLLVRFSPEVVDRFPTELGGEWIPNLIDEIPVLAVLGTRLRHGFSVRGARELRTKESDRIHTVVVNLRSLGVQVEEFEDGFSIAPGQAMRGGQIRTFGDHRIAMAFAVAGLVAEAPLDLDDATCAAVSFPRFFETLRSACA